MLRRARDLTYQAALIAAAVGIVAVIGLTYWLPWEPLEGPP